MMRDHQVAFASEYHNQITLPDYIQTLKDHGEFSKALVYHRYLPPSPPVYGPNLTFHNDVAKTLEHLGLDRLYCHQVEAIKHLRQGSHVMVATPTASGKSLIYNLVVLEEALRNRAAKALYIFPLKALEQDQLKNLGPWLEGIKKEKISAEIYDGDTTPYRRKKIRTDPPQILFTTPDMLHHGILAHHQNYASPWHSGSPSKLGSLVGASFVCDFGRSAHLSGDIRLSRQPGDSKIEAALPILRRPSSFYSAVGHRE
jgi:ATP-dependent helicase YprA (DUF1998 family)